VTSQVEGQVCIEVNPNGGLHAVSQNEDSVCDKYRKCARVVLRKHTQLQKMSEFRLEVTIRASVRI
jgi:hypothetical protein